MKIKFIRNENRTAAAQPINEMPEYPSLKKRKTVTVIQDPISAKLKRAINASLNLEAVFVINSETVTVKKQMIPKIAKGNGQ